MPRASPPRRRRAVRRRAGGSSCTASDEARKRRPGPRRASPRRESSSRISPSSPPQRKYRGRRSAQIVRGGPPRPPLCAAQDVPGGLLGLALGRNALAERVRLAAVLRVEGGARLGGRPALGLASLGGLQQGRLLLHRCRLGLLGDALAVGV